MNKKYAKVQSTRRSLIMSVLSLMLCIAMLIGTTYAWFTDSVTSGKNQIKAGNLDVALYHNGTDEIDENTDDLFNVDLWEPGVICYENFKVVNEGNLALKYAFSLNISAKNSFNGRDLSEVIKVAVVENGFSGDRAAAQALTFGTLADFQKIGHLDTKNASETYGVVLYWEPTNNDDLYNVNNDQKTDDNGTELFIEFGVNLFATQYTYESDSFDNQYDANAVLPATEPEEPGTSLIDVPAANVIINGGTLTGLSNDATGNRLDLSASSITEVAEYALAGNPDLVYVKLPGTLTHIGEGALNCLPNMETVEIAEGEGTLVLDSAVFYGLDDDNNPSALKHVSIAKSIKTNDTLGWYSPFASASMIFYGAQNLETVTLLGDCEFDDMCFVDVGDNCENGAVVTFGGNVKSTAKYSLFYLSNVTEVHFGSGTITGNMFNFVADSIMPGYTCTVRKVVFDAVPKNILSDSFAAGLPAGAVIEVADLAAWQEAGQPATIAGITVQQAPTN